MELSKEQQPSDQAVADELRNLLAQALIRIAVLERRGFEIDFLHERTPKGQTANFSAKIIKWVEL